MNTDFVSYIVELSINEVDLYFLLFVRDEIRNYSNSRQLNSNLFKLLFKYVVVVVSIFKNIKNVKRTIIVYIPLIQNSCLYLDRRTLMSLNFLLLS